MFLVVGATGQVGFSVVRRLRERGEQVVALVRLSTDPLLDRESTSIEAFLRQRRSIG